ncbi:MAG TPA: hypothetical protein VHU83_20650 [Bryobacteraceae bacterium]|jgi:hypothetical protein|nr:hypothetical protein [Bryobacteraceae bacterium]
MAKKNDQAGFSKILDAWNPPATGGDPVGCISTTFTFNPVFFETECLARFLGLETDAEDDALEFLIEQESRMSQLEAAVVLVDQQHCVGKRSLRWDLLPARIAGRLMHAKISVLAWEKAVRVIIASANLTEDGYRRNQEIFGVLDYLENSESPRMVLTDALRFLSELFEKSVLDGDGSPAVGRCRKLLRRLRQTPASWGVSAEDERRLGIKVASVFSGLQNASVLDQILTIWPSSTPPSEAWVISPFFDDAGQGADGPTKELWTKLRRRGDASLAFCVTTEKIPGDERVLVHAPASLLRAEPGRRSVKTDFYRIVDKENRQLHTKAIWLEGERHVLYLVGSSNFTTAGLNLSTKGNIEANLAYVADYQQHEKEARELESCFPELDLLDVSSVQWQGASLPEEESPPEAAPLPEAFGRAVYDASVAPNGRLMLRFLANPAAGWTVVSEDGEPVYCASKWEEVQRPDAVGIDWTAERPPSGLWVQWPADGSRSWWPVEVLSREALLPPEELRNLPLDILIRVLTSAQPLHRVLAAEIRRKREANGRSPGGGVITDPHKKVDVSGFLLQRSRRVAEAIEAVCGRVARPTPSEACLHWKIHGPVGIKSLVKGVVNEAKSSEERAFLLTELALALSRVNIETAPGGLSQAVVRAALSAVISEIRAEIPPGELAGVPQLSQYVERAFAEVAG